MSDHEEIEILLAEDNPRDAEMTLRALRKNNLANKVHWVKDGEQALDFLFCRGEYAERNPQSMPRLVLLDLKMPKVDGIEALRQIKQHERARFLPVVIMTSSNEESDVIESYRIGVNSYIVKPIDFTQFAETVAKIGLYWVLCNRPPN
jgi:two-component system, response regulator